MNRPRPTLPQTVGLGVVVLFVASFALAYTAQRGVPGREYTYVDVAFEDVGPALRPGNDVRVAGVRVGQVNSISRRDGRNVVRMQLDGDRPVYKDATALVDARSALGQKLVQLTPGTPDAGRVAQGEVLEPGPTGNATDLDALLSVLDEETRQAAASTLRSTGRGLGGHSQDLNDAIGAAPDLLSDAEKISRALSTPEADLDTMLATAKTLSERFAGREQELARLLPESADTLGAFAVDDGAPLRQGVRQSSETLFETERALIALGQPLEDLRATTVELREGGAALGAATGDIRATLREAVGPLRDVPAVADQAEPAVGALADLVTDARPLTPKVRRAFTLAQTPLNVLEPYSPEVTLWFKHFTSALSNGDENGKWLRFNVLLNSESFTSAGGLGGLGLPEATNERNPYPKPGVAQTQTSAGATP